MGFYLLRGPFLFSTAEWHVNWYHFLAANPYFPRPENWSFAFKILAVGVVMGQESMMRVLGGG